MPGQFETLAVYPGQILRGRWPKVRWLAHSLKVIGAGKGVNGWIVGRGQGGQGHRSGSTRA
jgi:hypothetical protein